MANGWVWRPSVGWSALFAPRGRKFAQQGSQKESWPGNGRVAMRRVAPMRAAGATMGGKGSDTLWRAQSRSLA